MPLSTSDSSTAEAYLRDTARVEIPRGELKVADYLRVARSLRTGPVAELRPFRLALLSSHTLNVVEPYLMVEAARAGLQLEVYFGAFGQFEQELADPASPLHTFAPNALVLALRPEDIDADAVVRYHATGGERFEQLAGTLVERLQRCVTLFREQSSAPVLMANFAEPAITPLGVFDAGAASLVAAYGRINERLRRGTSDHAGTVIWDYAGLVRSRGTAAWTDQRLWALGRIAVGATNQPALARHLVRTIAGVTRPSAKCLVLDLDNTLWGGVIGDDGLEGIALGDDYPGSVFKAFQRRVLALMDRGVLLAVVSKNDPDVVERAFREHPEMLIGWDQLAASRINWRPKSINLREIADELNLGADALVMFDDNPVERAEIAANAPEVKVIDVPVDPLQFEMALAECAYFDQPGLSNEDRTRNASYQQERQRREFGQRCATVTEFLYSLEMEACIDAGSRPTLSRVAQLVAKTNQFNLTTRRHAEADIAAMSTHPDYRVASLRLRDRFGDQGLVAVGILARRNGDAVVDTFLMSCRVMNRGVEQALMAHLVAEARRMGCDRVIGDYVPTRRNGLVQDFYSRMGFAGVAAEEGVARYALDLREETVMWPDVIRRRPHE